MSSSSDPGIEDQLPVAMALDPHRDPLSRLREGQPQPAAAPKPDEQPKPTLSPEAEAAKVAEELKGKTATDIPPGGAAAVPTEVDKMSFKQLEAIMDTPTHVLRRDPAKRKQWEQAFKRVGQTPPKLEGVLST